MKLLRLRGRRVGELLRAAGSFSVVRDGAVLVCWLLEGWIGEEGSVRVTKPSGRRGSRR